MDLQYARQKIDDIDSEIIRLLRQISTRQYFLQTGEVFFGSRLKEEVLSRQTQANLKRVFVEKLRTPVLRPL